MLMSTRVDQSRGREKRLSQSGGWRDRALSALGGVLLTGIAAWLVFGQNKVTRSEMEKMRADILKQMKERSVRAVDFAHVEEIVKQNAKSISGNASGIKELSAELRVYFQKQARAQAKLEATMEILLNERKPK